MFETLVYKGFSSLSFFRFCSTGSIGYIPLYSEKVCQYTKGTCLASTIILVAFQVVCQCLYRALGPRRLIGSTVSSKLYRDEGILCLAHVTVTVHEIPTKVPSPNKGGASGSNCVAVRLSKFLTSYASCTGSTTTTTSSSSSRCGAT